MRKITLTIFVLLALLLAGCGTDTNTANSSPQDGMLSSISQLMVGTFRLEGTSQAITSEEASHLLPLWQVYRSLNKSGTAAQEEIDALAQQIQETMTTSQVESIEAMNLTQEDVASLMVDQKIVESASQQGTSTEASASGFQAGLDGGMPPADIGGGGDPGMGIAGQTTSSSNASSNPEETPTMASSPGIPGALLEALIQLLQSKTA